MGWIRDTLREASERANELPPRARPIVTRRPLTRRPARAEEVIDWVEIASKRKPPRPRDKATLREHLKNKSPWRWAQLQRHLQWAEREMLKLGMNPEDVRWLL